MSRRRNIADSVLKEAKEWLEAGGTKKHACTILKVSNNKTMEAQIEEYDTRVRIDKEIRARKRKEAVSGSELAEIITSHLSGDTLEELSDSYYRSVDTIRFHLIKNGGYLRLHTKIDPLNPPTFPDECVADSFEVGQFVWSAKYGCIARIAALYKNAYRIRVWGEGTMEYSYQPSWELGSLKHLEDLGVDLSKLTPTVMTSEEIAEQINRTLQEANKKAKKDRL